MFQDEPHSRNGPPFDPSRIRRRILDMAFAGQTVHVGCAFSIVELLAVLYREHLQYDRTNPDWPGRDYLALSKGHGVMAQYACLNELGWISDAQVSGYFGNGTILKGLADAHVPGIEVSGGSLGHGLSVAVGLALAAKLRGSPQRCYVIVGDGELNEGAIWEAVLFAAHFKLDNLSVIVDENGFQAMGRTDEVIGLGDIAAKFQAFGFNSCTVDGHDEVELGNAYTAFRRTANGRPTAIVAKTIKGRGVSFMENDNIWHYTRLTPDSYEAALTELAAD